MGCTKKATGPLSRRGRMGSLAPLAVLDAAAPSVIRLASRTENTLVDCDASSIPPCKPGHDPATELTVPFFMYNPSSFSLYSNCDHSTFGNTKHSNALYFIDRIKSSSWRTHNMAEAKLAVVPILLDWYAHGLCNGSEAKHIANTSKIVRPNVDSLPHVVISASFATSRLLPKLQVALPSLRVGTYVAVGAWPASMPQDSDFVTGPCGFHIGFLTYHDTFSRKAPWNKARNANGLPVPGCERASLRVSGQHSDTKVQEKAPDATCVENNWNASRVLPSDVNAPGRRYLVEFVGQVDHRPGYADRWAFFQSRGKMNTSRWFVQTPTSSNITKLPQCNATAGWPAGSWCAGAWQNYAETQQIRESSEFSLMLRGDDQASDRLQNAVASLTIPVIIEGDTMEWLPFAHAINWADVLLVVKRREFDKNASGAVLKAMQALSHEKRVAKRQAMIKARREFLWDVPGSRVHENILQAAVLETSGWAPDCDHAALEYQAAVRSGRLDRHAMPMPTMRLDRGPHHGHSGDARMPAWLDLAFASRPDLQ